MRLVNPTSPSADRRRGRPATRRLLVGALAGVLAAPILLVPSHAVASTPCPDLGALSGLATDPSLWLRADCVDGTGTMPAHASNITTWHDVSGNDHDATVLTGQTAPTFADDSASRIGGRPVVRFDRTSQTAGSVLEIAGFDIRAQTRPDITIFVVYRTGVSDPALSNEYYGVFGNDNGAWDRFFLATYEPGPSPPYGNGTATGLISLGPTQSDLANAKVENAGTVGAVRLLAVVYDGEVAGSTNAGPADASRVYFGGELLRTFTDSTDATAAQTSLFIGWDGDSGAFRGEIAEFILFDTALSESDITTVNGYLNVKYDLQLTAGLPAPVSTPTPVSTLALSCEPQEVRAGTTITCAVSGGDPDIDILWRAGSDEMFAQRGVTLDERGDGTFHFTVPADISGEVAVELVEWGARARILVAGPVPTSVPAGDGRHTPWAPLAALVTFFVVALGARRVGAADA